MFESFPNRPNYLRNILAPLFALLLSACTVGPDYQTPVIQLESSYAQQDSTASELKIPEADTQFWRHLGDSLLESLVDDTLRANHDIRIALSRYEQARALTRQTGLDRYPTLHATVDITDQRSSASQAPHLSRTQRDGESHGASLSAIWELDFLVGCIAVSNLSAPTPKPAPPT